MVIDQQTAACIKVLFIRRKAGTTLISPGGLSAYHDTLQHIATVLNVTFPTYDAGSPTATDQALAQLLVDLETAAMNLLDTVI